MENMTQVSYIFLLIRNSSALPTPKRPRLTGAGANDLNPVVVPIRHDDLEDLTTRRQQKAGTSSVDTLSAM